MVSILVGIAAGAFVSLLFIGRALLGIEDELQAIAWELKRLRDQNKHGG